VPRLMWAEPIELGVRDTGWLMSDGMGVQRTLGADDGPIEIVDYAPSWPSAFVAERDRLSGLLPGVHLHHIGSTAVPGLAGKPVIDMIALVDDLDGAANLLVERGGYQFDARFNDGLLHRRYLCYPSISHRTHHLHLVDAGEEMQRCLRFRDKLRGDRQLSAAYVALKRSLAERFGDDRAAYTMAKTRFIEDADTQREPEE
jgi:GrpB-like predicted nucleotidyltransferase (UPF0157 family)